MTGQGCRQGRSCRCDLDELARLNRDQEGQALSREKLICAVLRTGYGELRHWSSHHRRSQQASPSRSQLLHKALTESHHRPQRLVSR